MAACAACVDRGGGDVSVGARSGGEPRGGGAGGDVLRVLGAVRGDQLARGAVSGDGALPRPAVDGTARFAVAAMARGAGGGVGMHGAGGAFSDGALFVLRAGSLSCGGCGADSRELEEDGGGAGVRGDCGGDAAGGDGAAGAGAFGGIDSPGSGLLARARRWRRGRWRRWSARIITARSTPAGTRGRKTSRSSISTWEFCWCRWRRWAARRARASGGWRRH